MESKPDQGETYTQLLPRQKQTAVSAEATTDT